MDTAVLIIEDEKPIADLLKERLDDEGYQANVAYCGSDALRLLKERCPDVVTLDMHLPDTNGLNLLSAMRSDPAMNAIPVIIISSSDDGENAKRFGADEYMRKPIDFHRLFERMKVLRQRHTAA